jgi:hypothetical protein
MLQQVCKLESLSLHSESMEPAPIIHQKKYQIRQRRCCSPTGEQEEKGKASFRLHPNTGPISTGCSYQERFCATEETQYGDGIDTKSEDPVPLQGKGKGKVIPMLN